MVKTCCAPNCRNRSKKPGISFFCFPKAPHLRREWVRRLNKANFQPTRHTVLCSEHFHGDNFISESVPEFLQLIGLEQRPIRRRLRAGAVPTLFKNAEDEWQEWERGSANDAATTNGDATIQCRRRRAEEMDEDDEDEALAGGGGGGDDEEEMTIKEEPGMEDEVMSEDEDRFVIQIDVAGEDQKPAELFQDLQPPGSSTFIIDHPPKKTDDHLQTLRSQAAQPQPQPSSESGSSDSASPGSKGAAESHSNPQPEESADRRSEGRSSSRPRRSCRNRGTGGLGLGQGAELGCQTGGGRSSSQCSAGSADDGVGSGSDGAKVSSRDDGRRTECKEEEEEEVQERGRRLRKSTHGNGNGSGNDSSSSTTTTTTGLGKPDDLNDENGSHGTNNNSINNNNNRDGGQEGGDPDEPLLCTIESVRSVLEDDDNADYGEQRNDPDRERPGKGERIGTEDDVVDNDDDGDNGDDDDDDDEYEVEEKDDDSSGTYSPSVSDASSPPAKKPRASRNKKKKKMMMPSPATTTMTTTTMTITTATTHAATRPAIPPSSFDCQPVSAGPPILCRIDPAFCKFQTVFQVPFASSPTFFSRTSDSMLVGNGAPVNHASVGVSNSGNNNNNNNNKHDAVADKADRGIIKGSSSSLLLLPKAAGTDSSLSSAAAASAVAAAADKTSGTRKGHAAGNDPPAVVADSLAAPRSVIVSAPDCGGSPPRLAASPVCTLPCCSVKLTISSNSSASVGLINSSVSNTNNNPKAVPLPAPALAPTAASVKQEILDPDDPPPRPPPPPRPRPLPLPPPPEDQPVSETTPKPDSTVPALAAPAAASTSRHHQQHRNHQHRNNLNHLNPHHLHRSSSTSSSCPVAPIAVDQIIPYRSEPINIPRYNAHVPYRSEPLRKLAVPIPTLPALLDFPPSRNNNNNNKNNGGVPDSCSKSGGGGNNPAGSASSRGDQKKPHANSTKSAKSSGDSHRADAAPKNGRGVDGGGVAFRRMTGSGDGLSGSKRAPGSYHQREKGGRNCSAVAATAAAAAATTSLTLQGKHLERGPRKPTTSTRGGIVVSGEGLAFADHHLRGAAGGDGAGGMSRGGGGGGGVRGVGGGGGQRLLLLKQQLSGKAGSSISSSSPSSFASASSSRLKPSPTVDTVSARLLAMQQKNLSPMNLTKQAVADQSSSATGSPFFIRRDHVLTDLLDIFKHSADRIHRGSVFRLCHDVSSATNSASPSAASLQDNWEDVSHKKLFSMFWAECLANYFDGYQQKVPKMDAQSSTSSEVPYLLGKILRHGLVLCGYWPVAVSTACAVSIFTGEKCSQDLFLRSLRQTMFPFEVEALDELLSSARIARDDEDDGEVVMTMDGPGAGAGAGAGGWAGERGRDEEDEGRLLETRAERRVGVVVQAYGGMQCLVPAGRDEVHAFVVELAAYYLYCQPFWWLREMRRGLMAVTARTRHDQDYLASMGEREVCDMYLTLTPTPQALLRRTRFRIDDSKQVAQNRVKGFLERSLLRMSQKELVRLLMKWSEADCLLDDSYLVIFTSSSSFPSSSSSASSSSGQGTPPLFRPSVNTLVLGHACPSFDLFNGMFRRLLNVR